MTKATSLAFYCFILLVGVSLLAKLGFWQIERGKEKEIIFAAYGEKDDIGPQSLVKTLSEGGELAWKKVHVTGKFIKPNIFIDNSIYKKQFGYQIVTPFVFGDTAVLVVRGWVKGPPIRSLLPNIATSYKNKKITGYLNKPPFTGISGVFDKSALELFGKDKIRIQKIDRIKIEEIIKTQLINEVLYLKQGEPDSYLVQNENLTKKHKHFAYAAQWFGMAFVLFAIGFINIKKKFFDDSN